MNEIKHFMLPSHTNNLYKNEARSSLALTKDVANKINELVDAYNNLIKGNLEKDQEQDGRIRGAVLYMKDNLINSLYELLKLYMNEEELKPIVEAVLDGIDKKVRYITPEMYGAVGDGVADDTQAFKTMIESVEMLLPVKEFEGEEPCKDYSGIEFKFSGKYKISEGIVFDTTYGLTLNNLHLVASSLFTDADMLTLSTITRGFKANGLTIDGKHFAPHCLAIRDYTLGIDISNAEISHFLNAGIIADGKGHELKLTNVRINQHEWGEWQKLEKKQYGEGINLGADRHDNLFTNVVISYCENAGLYLAGGTNKFVNCHFYSCNIKNIGRYNTFTTCYFDNAPFYTDGFFTVTNSVFLKSEGDTTPFIYFTVDSDANNWKYDTAILNDNTFKAVDYVSDAIDLGTLTVMPRFTTIGNSFYYVLPFTSQYRKGHALNPWDVESESYVNDLGNGRTEGYKIFGKLIFIWGYHTKGESDQIYFPEGKEVKEYIHIGFEKQDNNNPNLVTWCNNISDKGFWINGIGTNSTVKWFVIGTTF